jgi:hypothetical protein
MGTASVAAMPIASQDQTARRAGRRASMRSARHAHVYL